MSCRAVSSPSRRRWSNCFLRSWICVTAFEAAQGFVDGFLNVVLGSQDEEIPSQRFRPLDLRSSVGVGVSWADPSTRLTPAQRAKIVRIIEGASVRSRE